MANRNRKNRSIKVVGALALSLSILLASAACGSSSSSAAPEPSASSSHSSRSRVPSPKSSKKPQSQSFPSVPQADKPSDGGSSAVPSPAPVEPNKKVAASIPELAQKKLEGLRVSDQQKDILDRTVRNGSMSTADYESAWANVKHCMADKGYPNYELPKTSSGLYETILPFSQANRESWYVADAYNACVNMYAADVSPVYTAQVSNPKLYADPMQAAVDCLHRQSLVPDNYTLEQFNREMNPGDRASGKADPLPFDPKDDEVQSCLVPNGILMQDDNNVVRFSLEEGN
ncbi:hypothetical protein KIM372_03440 [Bombiscardovia nodaiensis]|uniref:Lipoprotein n=1 Tax=Bombiscardovia nodaiensis TaxID=2932181 RepID=A0ABN6S8G6_9BIFI|nr:hypothetical protein KIM372_03440 [Bombiscardovia nodaiensis]